MVLVRAVTLEAHAPRSAPFGDRGTVVETFRGRIRVIVKNTAFDAYNPCLRKVHAQHIVRAGYPLAIKRVRPLRGPGTQCFGFAARAENRSLLQNDRAVAVKRAMNEAVSFAASIADLENLAAEDAVNSARSVRHRFYPPGC